MVKILVTQKAFAYVTIWCVTQTRIESGLLEHFEINGPCVIITDSNVARLYGEQLKERLCCPLIVFPAGEAAKVRETKHQIEDALLKHKIGADATLIALGGGVVSDLVGFVSATYCRGVDLLLIPTTVTAMCDAAIGGKNGVNIGTIKNAIGTVYHPKALFIDPKVLKTLPQSEYVSGTAEMLKHGLIWSKTLWEELDVYFEDWQTRDPLRLQRWIAWNIQIKQEVIGQGVRDYLNFGHTIGHAIEMLTGISHGDAVALGMWHETLWNMGYCQEIHDGLKRFGFNLDWPEISIEDLWRVMQHDKKKRADKLYAVALEKIGRCAGLREMTQDDLCACCTFKT